MNGPSAISFQEIESWSRLTGNSLSSWEVDVIVRLDKLYLETMKG